MLEQIAVEPFSQDKISAGKTRMDRKREGE